MSRALRQVGRLSRRARLPQPLEAGTVALEVAELHVRLGHTDALAGVTLGVRAGEILALVGPNGAGKTTLLNAMAGDLSFSTGQVLLRDRPLHHWTLTEMAMRRTLLPQRNAVSFPFTVAEVVAMGRFPWVGTPLEDNDETAIMRAMRAVEVEDFAGRSYGTLSGGEQARVALARALAQSTSTLLLDEPTAALDLHHQEVVLSLTRTLAATGVAVVIVLHDLNLAAAYADRIAILAGGRLVALGPPADVLTADLLSTTYQHPIAIWPNPHTTRPIIVPKRRRPTPQRS